MRQEWDLRPARRGEAGPAWRSVLSAARAPRPALAGRLHPAADDLQLSDPELRTRDRHCSIARSFL